MEVSMLMRSKNLRGIAKELTKMARPAEFESATSASGGQRSIQLSYGRLGLRLLLTDR